LDRRAQLVAELEVVDADAAWASVSDEAAELADARSLRRQTDALRRALADLDRQIASEQNCLLGRWPPRALPTGPRDSGRVSVEPPSAHRRQSSAIPSNSR
jgi:hypothetical protein